MPLLTLGKTVSNNVTGTYTPGGLIPALLSGVYEANRGVGAMHVAAPQGISDCLWVLSIIWSDPAISAFPITWDDSYKSRGGSTGIVDGTTVPSLYHLVFYSTGGVQFLTSFCAMRADQL